jgi:hypothetical protein
MVYPRESKKTDTTFGIDYRGLRMMRKPILSCQWEEKRKEVLISSSSSSSQAADSQFMAMQHIPLIALQLISKVHRTFGVLNSKEEPFTFLLF